MKSSIKNILWTCYVTSLFVFFLYYLFPSDTIKRYIIQNISKKNRDVLVEISDMKMSFPLGLKFYDVNIYKKSNLFLNIKELDIFPKIFKCLRKEKSFSFKAHAYKGLIIGNIRLSTKTIIYADINISHLNVDNITALHNFPGYKVYGNLDLTAKYHKDKTKNVKADAVFKLSECTMKIENPYFLKDDFIFDDIHAKLVLNNNMLKIDSCNVKGKQVNGSLSGSISLKKVIKNSILNIEGIVKPEPDFIKNSGSIVPLDILLKRIGKKQVPFRIKGRIGKPEFVLR